MPTVEQQVEWWTKQAAHDLAMAKSNRENGFHDGCALMCQQSAEKYLKALFLKQRSATPPKTHKCEFLATMLGAPANVLAAARTVESDYMETRYPDIASGVPYEEFDDTTSQERVQVAEEIQQWVLTQLVGNP